VAGVEPQSSHPHLSSSWDYRHETPHPTPCFIFLNNLKLEDFMIHKIVLNSKVCVQNNELLKHSLDLECCVRGFGLYNKEGKCIIKKKT
jgi:hypothetical protein